MQRGFWHRLCKSTKMQFENLKNYLRNDSMSEYIFSPEYQSAYDIVFH